MAQRQNSNPNILKLNNIIRIPCSLNGSFFRYWIMFLKPFHHLTEREMDIAASLLKQRHELSKVITDNNVLDKVLMGEETKQITLKECGITHSHFQVILGKLRKNKVIVDGRLNPRFIPKIKADADGSFQLLLYFDMKNE